jgi:hypothetical protein
VDHDAPESHDADGSHDAHAALKDY